jgi:hypothetical protein
LSLSKNIAALVAAAFTSGALANTYNVTGTADGAGSVVLVSGTTYNASTLRAAANAVNGLTGTHTINLPPGTYNLTLGELQFGANGNLTVNLVGTGTPANTVVQHDTSGAIARVFNFDPNLLGGVNLTVQNLTIAHGRNSDGNGGAGVIAGYQGNPGAADATTFSNCVFFDNRVIGTNATAVGGGLQNIGGSLVLANCTFASNSAGLFSGGGVYYDSHSPSAGTCLITACSFTNNTSGDSVNGGGALFISGVSGSSLSIADSTFGGNAATNTASNGGAILKFGGAALTISNCAFLNNQVTGPGTVPNSACGGAIANDGGPMNILYCRFAGNATAATGHGNAVFNNAAAGATLSADNDWWASNTGPGANLVGATAAAWLKLSHYAAPNAIPENSPTTLTASVLTNSAGAAIPLANLRQLLGLPITFNNAVKGAISLGQSFIQPNGTATATFTSGSIPGAASADAVVDGAAATALINILCPAISGTLSGGATVCSGNPVALQFTVTGGVGPYTVTLNNSGGATNGPSPLRLVVSPSATTTYAVASAVDSYGCPVSASGSATIIVNPAPSVVLTPNPVSVCASSAGNTASIPAGAASYAWTILNGTFTSPTNAPTVTYTAGNSGNVTLSVTASSAAGCAGTNSLLVPIHQPPVATITPIPASVPANTPGNLATSPAGLASYAWTIDNGVITSATNTQSITYVSGPSGHLLLGLTVTDASGCSSTSSVLVPISAPPLPPAGWSFRTNYFASLTFTDVLSATTLPMAFDGTNYWSCSGGSPSGVRLAQYDTNGVVRNTYSPGLDFRSLFTDATGALYARAYADDTIYRQTAPGVFVPSGVSLPGSTSIDQSAIVLNGTGTEYIGMDNGTVWRWDTEGQFLGTVNLIGFGSVAGEGNFPQNRGLGAFGNLWVTYSGAGFLSVWDTFGHRVATSTLTGAGASFDSDFSLSYCNGKFFVVDIAGGLWRGYDVGNAGRTAVFGAPSTAAWNSDVQSKITGSGQIPQVDAFLVSGTNPVPTLADFRRYESVLVYSDTGFNNNVSIGNALADYLDLGGGVSLATFAYWSSGDLSIQGRLVTGNYLPFSTAAQSSGTNLTLVKNLPSHSILNGVDSFNGGSANWINYPISITSTSALVAHWSNGQPLVGARDIAPGRIAGLNFYPPSADVLGGAWPVTVPGGLLMANSLLWAGKAPPTIVSGPANQTIESGNNVIFNVAAVGIPPLTYQWRRNGTNITGATTATLSFTVSAADFGQYSAVVSNAYGLAISKSATLGAPLRLQVPAGVVVGAPFTLFISTVDGSPITLDRAARISLYSSTSAALPLATWALLNNPMVLTNGSLRVDALLATPATTFYRAAESP